MHLRNKHSSILPINFEGLIYRIKKYSIKSTLAMFYKHSLDQRTICIIFIGALFYAAIDVTYLVMLRTNLYKFPRYYSLIYYCVVGNGVEGGPIRKVFGLLSQGFYSIFLNICGHVLRTLVKVAQSGCKLLNIACTYVVDAYNK